MPIEILLNKEGMFLRRVFSIKKKISPKIYGPHCVIRITVKINIPAINKH